MNDQAPSPALPPVVDRKTWQEAREALFAREKARGQALAQLFRVGVGVAVGRVARERAGHDGRGGLLLLPGGSAGGLLVRRSDRVG